MNVDNSARDGDQRPAETAAAGVARRVRRVLSDRHLSLEWLAAQSGISSRTLGRRLHVTNPGGLTVDELNAIAIALAVDPSRLLRDEG